MSRRLVNWGAVKGLPVVCRAEGSHAGKLDDVLVRVEDLSALGYKLKAPGFWGGARGVAAEAVELLGKEYVIVRDEAAVEAAGESRGSLDDRVWASAWLGCRCLTRRGNEVGKLADLVFDATGHEVCAFLLDGNRLVVPGPAVAVGADSVIVNDESSVEKLADAAESSGWWKAIGARVDAGPPR